MTFDFSKSVRSPEALMRVDHDVASKYPEAFQDWLEGKPIQVKAACQLSWDTVDYYCFNSPTLEYRPVPADEVPVFKCMLASSTDNISVGNNGTDVELEVTFLDFTKQQDVTLFLTEKEARRMAETLVKNADEVH